MLEKNGTNDSEISVLVLLADGFEELEVASPMDILRRGGIRVTLASVGANLQCSSTRGLTISGDILLADLGDPETSGSGFDLLYLPGGGPGYDNLRNSELVLNWVRFFDEKKMPLAAICGAPLVLAAAGVISRRKITSFPGVKEELLSAVGEYSEERVVSDGHIFTSRGAGTAAEFSFVLLELLKGRDVSEKIHQSMLF